MASPQDKIWYVVIQNKADGPHSEEELREWLRNRKITYTDLAFRTGLSRWVPLAECAEFERRNDSSKTNNTFPVTLDIPQDKAMEGWILLTKHTNQDGSSHFIQSGPHTTEQIRDRLQRQEIRHDDHIWQKNFTTWKSVGSVEDFDRRRPPTFETQPKPEVSKGASLEKADTGGIGGLLQVDPITQPFKKSSMESAIKIETKPEIPRPNFKPNFKIEPTQYQEAMPKAEPKGNQLPDTIAQNTMTAHDTVIGPPAPEVIISMTEEEDVQVGSFSGKRLGLSVGGAIVGMLIAFAGIKAYKQTLNHGPSPVLTPPHPVANMALPPPPGQGQAPVHPEMANRLPKKAQVLRITPLKTASGAPQLAFETDLPAGTRLEVSVSAQAGRILKYYSFNFKKEVVVNGGQLPLVDLAPEQLPPGDYSAIVKGGELSGSSLITVGVHDAAFAKKLAEFSKKVTVERKLEIGILDKGTSVTSRGLAALSKNYQKAKGKGASGRKGWNQWYTKWRKDFKKDAQNLQAVKESSRRNYVFPDSLLKLKKIEKSLYQASKECDQNLKGGRQVANDLNFKQEITSALNELKSDYRTRAH